MAKTRETSGLRGEDEEEDFDIVLTVNRHFDELCSSEPVGCFHFLACCHFSDLEQSQRPKHLQSFH